MTAAIADAMRKHDPIRLTALRMLKTALTNREVERGRALDDAESQNVVLLMSMISTAASCLAPARRAWRTVLALTASISAGSVTTAC